LWPVYRLILDGKITWIEAETVMSMQDILDFNEVYDVWFDGVNAPAPEGIR